MSTDKKSPQEYWKRNLSVLVALLSVWFAASFGCGVLFVDQLDAVQIGGFKLGFWFAQQGAMYVFVILIFVYVVLMNKIDKEFDVHED
jgi:putative solute:sodium symporter small subunit